MSPKHAEKCNLFLMILVLLLTIALAFMWRISNREPETIVKTVYVEVPVIQYVEVPVPLEDEPESPTKELTGVDLYLSYVDEITSDIYPDVDPLLVKAMIYHESRFVPYVVNQKSGTVGLMQISPKWHSARAEKLGVELSDPYGNILVGCDILHELYQSHSKGYSLNVYAGGYAYADKYRGRVSPIEQEIDALMTGITNGSIVLGGE